MRFAGGLSAVLFGTAIIIGQPLIATALKPDEIYPIAEKITVRIEGANNGSGVIIEQQGNTYTVLTNLHVVDQKGIYTVYTPDGKKCCTINSTQVTPLPNVDLAIFQFTSNQNYRVAQKGDSDQVTGSKIVYIAGYPVQIPGVPKGSFNFLSGQISSRIQNPQKGYALAYTVQAFTGMSGGPILDEEGKLVGIHGNAGTDPVTGGTATLGIPLKTYLSLAPSAKPPTITSPPVNSSTKFSLAKTLTGHSTKVIKDDIFSYIEGGVYSVAISPDGRTLASGSNDKTIKIWNLTTGQEIHTLKGHSAGVYSVAISPDGRTLASGSNDKTIKIWNLTTGQEIHTLKGHSAGVRSVAISPDGRTLASGSNDKTIKIWNLTTGQEIHTLKGHSAGVRSVAISPDGRTLASGSNDKTIKIWNLTTGQEIRTLNGHSAEVSSVAFSPDGRTLASGSRNDNDTIKIWNFTTGQEISTLKKNGYYGVNSVAFSPDGRTLASGSYDTTITIWNLATGQVIRTLLDIAHHVYPVAFSPDGKTLASGNFDKTIKIWNLTTGQEINTLNGHSGNVNSVTFSPDGRTLASGSFDATIKIWRLSE